MASKSKELSDLQRDLLQTALRSSKGKIWLPKAAAQSFPTTYAALASLQRRKLMDLETGKDSDVLTWKITKEGKEAVVPAKVVRAPVAAPPRKAAPAPKVPAEPVRRDVSAKAAPKAAPAAAPVAAPKPPAKVRAAPSPKARSAPPAAEAPRSRGGKGKQAVPPAKPAPSAVKKGAATKSGGRGRT